MRDNYRYDNVQYFAIAEELQLKGLMGNVSSNEAIQEKDKLYFQDKENEVREYLPSISKPSPVFQTKYNENIPKSGQQERAVALTSSFSGNIQELDQKCNSMMEKTLKKRADGLPVYRCIVCGKEAKSGDLKNHIETNHLDGISIPCNICEKTFRSRNAMKTHKHRYHKSNYLG